MKSQSGKTILLVKDEALSAMEVVRKTEAVNSYGYIVKDCAETVLLGSIKMAFRRVSTLSRMRVLVCPW
jgi:AmiR/NasT family two-component response regulator